MKYFRQAIDLFSSIDDNETAKVYSASINTNIFECLYKLKDVQGMGKTLEKIKENREFIDPAFLINLYESIYNTVLGDTKSIDSLINEAVEESLAEDEVFDNLDNYQLLCEFLIENRYMDSLGRVLDLIESRVSDQLLPKMQINNSGNIIANNFIER